MTPTNKKTFGGLMKRLFGALFAASLFAIPAHAADPIKIVVPFAAGGPTDMIARMIGQDASRPGGGPFGQRGMRQNQRLGRHRNGQGERATRS